MVPPAHNHALRHWYDAFQIEPRFPQYRLNCMNIVKCPLEIASSLSLCSSPMSVSCACKAKSGFEARVSDVTELLSSMTVLRLDRRCAVVSVSCSRSATDSASSLFRRQTGHQASHALLRFHFLCLQRFGSLSNN